MSAAEDLRRDEELERLRAELAELKQVLAEEIAAMVNERVAARRDHMLDLIHERNALRARLTGVAIHANRLANCIWPDTPAWVALSDLRAALTAPESREGES